MWLSIWIEWEFDEVFKINWAVSSAMQLSLIDISLLIQNRAKENSPYLTWTLRRSINTDFTRIQQWTVVVWSPVRYARVREFSNNLHPRTTFYLKRWYTDNRTEIMNIMKNNLSKELNN